MPQVRDIAQIER